MISSLFSMLFLPHLLFLPFSFVFLTFFSICTCFLILSPANFPHLEKLPQPLEKFPPPRGGVILGKYTPLNKLFTIGLFYTYVAFDKSPDHITILKKTLCMIFILNKLFS